MAYKDNVWAILGTIDGANSHIAIRVALKAEVTMMNTGDTDPTFIETNIPWVMRSIGDDRQQGYLLVDYLYRKLNIKRVGIIRASNRYGRFGVREIQRRQPPTRPARSSSRWPTKWDKTISPCSSSASRRPTSRPSCTGATRREGALILNQMRTMGMKQPFLALRSLRVGRIRPSSPATTPRA